MGRLKTLYRLLSGQAEWLATNGFLVDTVEASLGTEDELWVYLSLDNLK